MSATYRDRMSVVHDRTTNVNAIPTIGNFQIAGLSESEQIVVRWYSNKIKYR